MDQRTALKRYPPRNTVVRILILILILAFLYVVRREVEEFFARRDTAATPSVEIDAQ